MTARTSFVAVVTAASLLAATGIASAQFFDSRSMGLGGAKRWHHRGTLVRVNPAYRIVPSELSEPRWRFGLPLGLIQNGSELRSFDPDRDDLDLTRVGRWMLNVPWALQLDWQRALSQDLVLVPDPPDLLLDLGQARQVLPFEDFDLGNLNEILDLGYELNLGRRYGLVHLGVQGFAHNEAAVAVDDDLTSVLKEARPVADGQTYGMRGSGLLQTGLTLGATYARSIPLAGRGTDPESTDWLDDFWKRESQRPRLWVGAGVRAYLGLAYAGLDADARLTGRAPPASAPRFAVDYDAVYTTAHARFLGDFGTGFGLELGSVLRWRGLELGAGVADLFTELTWRNTRRDRVFLDPTTSTPARELVAKGIETRVDVPPSWLANASYPWRRTLFLTDLSGGPGGNAFHLGMEHALGRLALRMGTERDTRGAWQIGGGFGLLATHWGVDAGLRTHSLNLNEDRGVELGVNVVVAY